MKKAFMTFIAIAAFAVYSYFQNYRQSLAILSAVTVPVNTKYKDGAYTGQAADAYYGNIQVKAIVSGNRLTDVVFLDYPQDRQHSLRLNDMAMPQLKQEAIAAQNAKVDIVSGATDTSQAFRQSLSSALAQASL